MEWISVKDRLPDADGEYLVHLALKDGHPGRVQSLYWSERWLIDGYVVSYWMPLPEPPQRTQCHE